MENASKKETPKNDLFKVVDGVVVLSPDLKLNREQRRALAKELKVKSVVNDQGTESAGLYTVDEDGKKEKI